LKRSFVQSVYQWDLIFALHLKKKNVFRRRCSTLILWIEFYTALAFVSWSGLYLTQVQLIETVSTEGSTPLICGYFVDKLNWSHVTLKLNGANVAHGCFQILVPHSRHYRQCLVASERQTRAEGGSQIRLLGAERNSRIVRSQVSGRRRSRQLRMIWTWLKNKPVKIRVSQQHFTVIHGVLLEFSHVLRDETNTCSWTYIMRWTCKPALFHLLPESRWQVCRN
jgi:hypothetical protein